MSAMAITFRKPHTSLPSIRFAFPISHGSNDTLTVPLLYQIGSRLCLVLLNHIQQFRYSPHGALRLKADVNAYLEAVRVAELSQLTEKFIAMQVLHIVL